MKTLCSVCRDHLEQNKKQVREAYAKKLQSWNKLMSPGGNKLALAYQYELDGDNFEEEVSILVHTYKNILLPRH